MIVRLGGPVPAFHRRSTVRVASLAVLPQHSQDGPIVKWLNGLGNGIADNMDEDAVVDSDAEEGARRGRVRRRQQ